LPAALQRRAILFGTAGAIIVRGLLTIAAVSLLRIPGLMLVGGLMLFWIAYQLLAESENTHQTAEALTLRQALQTIIVADTVMGMDNVIAIAGAAQGDFFLVILGLAISIPLVVWGSTLVLHLLTRFPILVYAGSAVLVMTAVHMVLSEKIVRNYWNIPTWLPWLAHISAITVILGLGYLRRKNTATSS
ncbi:MAG: YjbE family putative metal transport protein, partial [Ottowia sp.]|nr:YjbE family putative metal transport protein [Ottowia sp.]